MKKRNAVIEDYYRLRYLGQPDYCGVTQCLAYAVASGDRETDGYGSEVWVKELRTGKSRRVTAGGRCESNPRLSADGKKLLFLSDAGGTEQIYVEEEGKKPRLLTHMRYAVHGPVWSPDGGQIAFLCDCEPELSEELLTVPQREEERGAEEAAIL